ncbi:MAG: hypothetical protein AseanaTS_05920 [Candidatus Pelagadaptatus aseana]|uniref:hypothetical protein n=1 Tax=Candidatus Pelagadaptatus aseana TaxID=3120508 RepID=UPI0039B169D1
MALSLMPQWLQAKDPVNILAIDYMPYVGAEGLVTKLAGNYCQQHHDECRFLFLPPGRAVEHYGSAKYPLLLGTLQILPKEKQAISDIYPFIRFYPTAFYLQDQRTTNWQDLGYEDLKGMELTVGIVRGFESEYRFFGEHLGLNVIKANTFQQLINLLVTNKIDLASGTLLSAHYHFEQYFPEHHQQVKFFKPYYEGVGGMVYLKDSRYAGQNIQAETFALAHEQYRQMMVDYISRWPDLNPEDFFIKSIPTREETLQIGID